MENNIEEIWVPVLGYEGLYEASDLGNVRSLNYRHTGKTKLLKPEVNHKGYLRLKLSKNSEMKRFLVHTLIYTTFKGPIPPGMQINHLNEIKTDNRPSNLEICTVKENNNWGTRNKRLAAANKGKKLTAEHRAKISAANKGRKITEEQKEKISATLKGRKLSEEHKAKLKGRKLSEEHKAKISASEKGRKLTAEHRAKISAAHKGRKITEEQKAKIAATLKGRPLSEETRAKISATLKARYQREKN